MMESPKPYHEQQRIGLPGGMSQLGAPHSVGGASGEITSPAMAYTGGEMPPDPIYGDEAGPDSLPVAWVDYNAETAVDEPDVRMALAPSDERLPARTREHLPARRVTSLARRDLTTVAGRVGVRIEGEGGERLIVPYEGETLDGEVDDMQLMRDYVNRLRSRVSYRHEGRFSRHERDTLARCKEAQLRLADRLQVLPQVEDDIDNTPYHAFDRKPDMDRVVIDNMGVSWLRTRPGMYSPFTGALWTHTDGAYTTESGISRLVAESSATFIGLPEGTLTGDAAQAMAEKNVEVGIGFNRPDLVPRLGHTGLHDAMTDLAAMRVLREAGFEGAPLFYGVGTHLVLDQLIRTHAHQTEQHPREVANGLLASYYSGDLNNLFDITRRMTKIARIGLLTMHGNERLADMQRLSVQMHMPDLARQYQAERSGALTRIYNWY
jgi:hypothetical protein